MPQTNELVFSLIFFSGLLGIVVACILVFANKNQTLAPRLLGFYLFSFSIIIMQVSLTYTSFFLHYPYLWRTPCWATFFAPSLAYLYVRSVLYQSFKFKKTDRILLLLPAGLYTLNMLPLFTLSTAEKLNVVSRFMADRSLVAKEPEGWLPIGWGIAIRMIHGLVLVIAQYVMLFKMRQRVMGSSQFIQHNRAVFRWLFLFTSVLCLFYVVITTEYIFHFNFNAAIATPIFFTLAATVLFISLYLFTQPAMLYGLQGWMAEPKPVVENATQTVPLEAVADKAEDDEEEKRPYLTFEQGKKYKLVLEEHLDKSKPFLKQGYKLKDLCDETGIPSYQLSAFINQEYGQNFNELINSYRISHISGLLKTSPEYLQFTLDALAKDAGFSSRNGFFNAVKKITGKAQSDYFGLKVQGLPA